MSTSRPCWCQALDCIPEPGEVCCITGHILPNCTRDEWDRLSPAKKRGADFASVERAVDVGQITIPLGVSQRGGR